MQSPPSPQRGCGDGDEKPCQSDARTDEDFVLPPPDEMAALDAWADEVIREAAVDLWSRDPLAVRAVLDRLPDASPSTGFFDLLRMRRRAARAAQKALANSPKPSPGQLLRLMSEQRQVGIPKLAEAFALSDALVGAILAGTQSVFASVRPQRLPDVANVLGVRLAALVAGLEEATRIYFERQVASRAGGALARSDRECTGKGADLRRLAQAALTKECAQASAFFVEARRLPPDAPDAGGSLP